LNIEAEENLIIFGVKDSNMNVKPKEISFNDWNFIKKFKLYADEIRQLYEARDEQKKQSIIAILKNKIAKSQKVKIRSKKDFIELFETNTGNTLSWNHYIVINILESHPQSLLKKEIAVLKSWASSDDEIQKAVKKIKKYIDAWDVEGKRIGLFGKSIIPKKIKDEEVISFLQTIGAIELDETSDEDKPLSKLKNPLEQVVGRREERTLGVPRLPPPIPKPMATKPISRPAITPSQNLTLVRKEPGTLKPISRPKVEKKKEESDSDTDDEDVPLSMLRKKPNIVSDSETDDESDDEMKIPNPDVMWLEQKEREEKNREEDSESDTDDDKPLSYYRRGNNTNIETDETDESSSEEETDTEEEEKTQNRPAAAVRRIGDRKTEKEKDKNFARYGQRKTFREIKNDLGLTTEEYETLKRYPRGKKLQEQIANFYKYKEKSMPTSTQSALSAVQKILKNKAREALLRKKEKTGSKKGSKKK